MIDWPTQVIQLKQMADELELLASKSHDRGRLVMGRIADELRRLAADIERALGKPDRGGLTEPVPEWLAAGLPAPEEYPAEADLVYGEDQEWWEGGGESPDQASADST